jgi:uncharacterized protein YndB with AHSA1/START domain
MNDQVFSIEIRAPQQRVWDEITKVGRVQPAVVNTILESAMTPGSKLRYYSANRKRVFVVGEVLEVTPPTRFVHTFVFTARPETPSVVTWELEAIPGGCRVTLTHGGWTDQAETYKGVTKGWREILDLLRHVVETGNVPAGIRVRYAVLGALMFLLPKRTRPDEVARAGW